MNTPSSSIASTFSTSASVSSSSRSATDTIVAWRSSETSPALGLSRYVLARRRAVISPSSTKSRTNALKRGESTAYASERMTTMSVAVDRSACSQAERRLRVPTRGCWWSTLGREAPPRSVTTATIASTVTTIQALIALHGWRALAEASLVVESIMSARRSGSRPVLDGDRALQTVPGCTRGRGRRSEGHASTSSRAVPNLKSSKSRFRRRPRLGGRGGRARRAGRRAGAIARA